MPDKYFRIMQTPTKDWKPFRIESMYDEAPQYGSYESTSGVEQPIEGDYIIADDNGTRVKASSFERDLDHVEFHAMPVLSDLLRNREIIEVPEWLAQFDCNMKYEITSLDRELQETEDAITMAEHRLSDPNVEPEEIKSLKSWCSECRRQFSELSDNLNALQAEYQTKVIAALPADKSPKLLQESERADKIQTWLRNEINSASQDMEMGYQQDDLEL